MEVAQKREFKKAGHGAIPFSLGMSLIALGVVYGDIGTSPLYVMKAIVTGNGGIQNVTPDMVIGAVSLILWTLTLLTTVKYVLIAMKADNHHEGGIFALYSLVRKCSRYLIIPAMIGGAALLADGILTPAVTVTTAIEGLRTIDFGHAFLGDSPVIVVTITVVILCGLFLLQRAGTSNIGRLFGPIMLIWFLFLGVTGLINMSSNLEMLRALNPVRGVMFLFGPANKAGFAVLGFVFLATTGAEALYSDMGHVGKANIYSTWPFICVCLFLNYMGQGAWIIAHQGDVALVAKEGLNPFFEMLMVDIRPFAVVLAAIAGLIASQALITGSYTLVSEATRLNLMPHLRIVYPSLTKGQLYIPLVNNFMWIGCIGVVLLFRTSYNMEAAYGLAITMTMLSTTLLLHVYLDRLRHKKVFSWVFLLFFGVLEGAFFISSLAKFTHGGYVTVIIAALLFLVMFVWKRGSAIERSQSVFLPIVSYVSQLKSLSSDKTVPLFADNLVFLTNYASQEKIDRDILYSILDKRPKRAKCYFFINVRVTDNPYDHEYTVDTFGTDFIFKVTFYLGFKMNQRVNRYLHQVMRNLQETGEMKPQHLKYSIYRKPGTIGEIRYCLLRKMLTGDVSLRYSDRLIMATKYAIRRICGSPAQWFNLVTSHVTVEFVPLFNKLRPVFKLERIPLDATNQELISLADEEEDVVSANLSNEAASVVLDTEQNVIGGEDFSDQTGCHPKLLLDENGNPIIQQPDNKESEEN